MAVTLIWMIDAVVRRGNVSGRRGSRLALTPGARTPPPSWVGQRPRPTARVGRTGRVAYWSRVTGDGDALKADAATFGVGGGVVSGVVYGNDRSSVRASEPSPVVPLMILVLGLAVATMWFVVLPALEQPPPGRTCEVVFLQERNHQMHRADRGRDAGSAPAIRVIQLILARRPLPRAAWRSPLPRPRPVLLDLEFARLAMPGGRAVAAVGTVARVPMLGAGVAKTQPSTWPRSQAW